MKSLRPSRTLSLAGALTLAWLGSVDGHGLARAASPFSPRPDLNFPELQTQVTNGLATNVLQRLDAALEKDPDNARLLYNRGVAAYAAGQFEDALVAFDRAETGGNRQLARLARFQKGNAEFRLGETAQKGNLDETISRWKQSLEDYREALKEAPEEPRAQANYRFVKQKLLALLLQDAKRHAEAAKDPRLSTSQKLDQQRNAFEKYTEAKQVDPENAEAQAGEKESRDQLAQALAQEGKRLANQPLQPKFNPREPALPDFDTKALEEGVGMLEDAHHLAPENKPIEKDLAQAREKLADADVQRAQRYMELEERTPWTREKLAVLRMGRELAEKALDQVKDYKPAQEVRDEINRRLAQIHEEEGDALAQQSQQMNVEQQSMALSQALDHFEQANELQPGQSQLPPKIQQTGEKLAQALEKMADKLMQTPKWQESLEQQIGRLEGADQALSELQGLKPSEQTQQKSEQVGEQLAGLRQKAAQKGQQPGQGQPQPIPGQGQGQQMVMQGPPMDSRPRINTPGSKGEFNSKAMNAGRDY
jgi:tetratricopeptide (TPR) repeat protein